MRRHSCGFLFSADRQRVLLIEKNEPETLYGKLSCIGGTIEGDEAPHAAMKRGFQRITGVDIPMWDYMVHFNNPGRYEIHFFKHFSDEIEKCGSEDRILRIIPVKRLPPHIVYNVRWLIPLCLDYSVKGPIEIMGGRWEDNEDNSMRFNQIQGHVSSGEQETDT